MKIATKLKIATLAPLILAIVSGSAILFSNHAVEEAQKSVRTVREVIHSVNNLNTLVYSYMLYQEERSKQQFLAEHEHITRLISTINFRNLREMELRDRLSYDVASMKGLFVKMTTSYERLKMGNEDLTVREAGDRLGGQLLANLSQTVADGLVLSRVVTDTINSHERRLYQFVFALIITATISLTVILAWAMNKISLSLKKVSKGAEIVGSGNLHYFIEEGADDEIGHLCRAFNEMTRKLGNSYDVLESEIGERRRAESELRKAKDELELRVLERTAALRKAIDELQVETRERVRTVEELREKEQMLTQQSRMAAMGEMLLNISHHWRQPLNLLAVKVQQLGLAYRYGGFSETLLNDNIMDVMGIIKNMSHTIDDFQHFLAPVKEKSVFAVDEVVTRTVSLIEEHFMSQGVAIETVCTGTARIYGDPNEYGQVLMNLLNNARDALLERRDTDRRITVRSRVEKETSLVTITDNAGGIAGDIQEKIFDAYFTTKELGKGTGVGLFLSRMIVEKNMGGRLRFRNVAGGAEFEIQVEEAIDRAGPETET